jgi:RNA-binding protein
MTGKQLRTLRALAHPLKPVLQIGKQGLSEALIQQLDEALLQHELLKIKVLEAAPFSAKECSTALQEQPDLTVAQVIGHTVVLYRAHPENPQIELPSE